MDTFPFEIIILFILILANGVLAMSEIAVVSARKVRLQQRANAGNSGAKSALKLAESPGRFLSTVQIGITLVGILAGAFGGAALAEDLQPLIATIQPLQPYSQAISFALIVLIITYLSLVFGELAPKQIALIRPEDVASTVAPFMDLLARLTAPVVSLLTASTGLILRLLGVSANREPAVTEEEIRILIGQGTESGIFEPIEEEMVEQVFRLGDRRVSSLTTPRPDIIWLDITDPPEITTQKILESRHTYFPVAEDSLDQLMGFVRANDLLAQCMGGKPLDLQSATQPAIFVPENMFAFDVLERFKQNRSQIAFAIDEYGGIQGIITLRDILEAIVGDIPQPHEEQDPDIIQREDGSWLLNAMLPVEELKDLLELKDLPGEKEKYFNTLGGFVMTYLGRIPRPGDRFEWQSFFFEVVDMDGNRVDKVLVDPVEK